MRWQEGRDDRGTSFVVDDPLADVTAARLAGTRSAADKVAALLSIEAIFPPALAADDTFRALLAAKLDLLHRRGAMAVLEDAA